MHVPKSDTLEIPVLSFSEALQGRKDKAYDPERWLYVPDFYSEYRYVLGTKGKNPLICIGINPSTAEPDHLDRTLESVQRIAHFNSFDSFLMFNVYAQRATDPDHMEKVMNPYLHAENMKAFRFVLSQSEAKPVVWAAWGTIIEKRHYLKYCVRDMIAIGREFDARWVTCGARSKKSGHPHHPLYLKKDSLIENFDPEVYLESLR